MAWIRDEDWNNLIERMDRLERRVERLTGGLQANERRDHMATRDTEAAIARMNERAAAQTTVTNGLVVAVEELKEAVAAAGDDADQINAAVDAFEANTTKLAGLIVQGTAAEGEKPAPIV